MKGWITNALKSTDHSQSNCVLGDPKPTALCTKQQLLDEGIVGLYTVDGHEPLKAVVTRKRSENHGTSRKTRRNSKASSATT